MLPEFVDRAHYNAEYHVLRFCANCGIMRDKGICTFSKGLIYIFRVAVCEDNPIQAEIILSLLEKYQAERPGINIQPYVFDSGDSVLSGIKDNQGFNLFLLDILLPGMNGIELARELRTLYADVPLIFLTSSPDYALDAFKVSASQYILKPIKQDELFPVLDNITTAIRQEKERLFVLSTPHKTVKIPYNAIVCVELVGRALRFYLDNGEVLLSRTIRISFAEAIASLLEDSRFLCEHKSFALNMAYVQEIGNNMFKMQGGIEVPIPRYNFAKAKARYLSWLKEQEQS